MELISQHPSPEGYRIKHDNEVSMKTSVVIIFVQTQFRVLTAAMMFHDLVESSST